MKSRLVALALAAVMTLGSCMSASAKDVFTKYMIGGTVVKNGAYVEHVDLFDISINEAASKDSLYAFQLYVDALKSNTQAGKPGDTISSRTNAALNNTYQVAFNQLTTVQQEVLIRMIQQYGQTAVINAADDTAATAPYSTGVNAAGKAWSYAQWVSRMQIAPYAERYIVALNYKSLYEGLRKLADYAVAQGQITAADAFANTTDIKDAMNALSVIQLTKAEGAAAGDWTYSGAKFRVNKTGAEVNVRPVDPAANYDIVTVRVDNVDYALVPATLFGASLDYARFIDKSVVANATEATGTFYGIPLTGRLMNGVVIATQGSNVVTRIPANTAYTINATTGAGTVGNYRNVDGSNVTPIQILYSYLTYTGVSYQETVENALEVAKEMQKSFKTAETYYDGQIKEGVAYLINCVRPDLADVKAANIDTTVGFDIDPYDNLKWELKEKKTIAFTSPSINDKMKETQSCVVLHFDTTACKWESIDAKFVKYNNVLGIEGDFTSCSPVIVVTLKDYVDNGAAAAATATDAKKSPTTGENF